MAYWNWSLKDNNNGCNWQECTCTAPLFQSMTSFHVIHERHWWGNFAPDVNDSLMLIVKSQSRKANEKDAMWPCTDFSLIFQFSFSSQQQIPNCVLLISSFSQYWHNNEIQSCSLYHRSTFLMIPSHWHSN